MNRDERNIEEVLERSLPSASTERMESARERIFNYVQSEDAVDRNAGDDADFNAVRGIGWLRLAGIAAVAAVMIAAIWFGMEWQARGVYARLETADSSVSRISEGKAIPVSVGERIEAQEIVRAGSEGSAFVLADGSRVEMRAQSELSLERADDGVRIRLNSGDVIVNAAKQHGHLYVQTRDLKVSVVGTVFLVNADDKGSRVAVIEGEVRVKQGTEERSLRPGEQLASNPKSENLEFFRQTGWSREAFAYLSKLHESMAQSLAARQSQGRTTSVSDKPQFEEASIRPCKEDFPSAGGRGGGGNGSIRLSPGRVDALCMTVPTLINMAHRSLNNNPHSGPVNLPMNVTVGYLDEDGTRVRGGPDWVRSEKYTVAAVGDSMDGPTLQGPMLLDLLERRFNLKLRVETEEIPVYAITIAKGGLKIKPLEIDSVKYEELRKIRASLPPQRGPGPRGEALLGRDPAYAGLLGCSYSPLAGGLQSRGAVPGQAEEYRRFVEALRRDGKPPVCGFQSYVNGPNNVITSGASPIGLLVDSLEGDSGSRNTGLPFLSDTLNGLLVVDKTALPDTNCLIAIPSAGSRCAPLFNYFLEYAIDESFFTRNGRTPTGAEVSLPKAPTVFAALEQLGLHLEKNKAPREFIVIEHVERLSPN